MADKTKTVKERGSFSSRLGFILASTGSAIGLGNLWKFPYVAGTSGGGLFLLIYILFMLLLGIPIIFTEFSIGKKMKLNPIDAYSKLNKKCGFIGFLGAAASFAILSFYSVVGGWVLKYFILYLTKGTFEASPNEFFSQFSTSAAEPVIWHILFIGVCFFIVCAGISNGIERVSKIMLPALFIIILVLCVRSVTLHGSSEGLRFLFFPHPDQLSGIKGLSHVAVLAMGQVFFSLSLGTGIGITYGSYLDKKSNLVKDSVVISVLDTLIAVLAGIAIIPAVFALGLKPNSGPGLIFETLPLVFEKLFMGRIFGLLFFLLVFFAAVTSAISMLEVVASYLIDHYKMNRKTAVFIVTSVIAISGSFASLSLGGFEINLFGLNLFDFFSFASEKLFMPLAALFTCIYIGHFYKGDAVSSELTAKPVLYNIYSFLIKWITPVLILIIFILGLI